MLKLKKYIKSHFLIAGIVSAQLVDSLSVPVHEQTVPILPLHSLGVFLVFGDILFGLDSTENSRRKFG